MLSVVTHFAGGELEQLATASKEHTRVHSMVCLVVDYKTWAVCSLAHRVSRIGCASEMTLQEDAIYSLRAGRAGLALPS